MLKPIFSTASTRSLNQLKKHSALLFGSLLFIHSSYLTLNQHFHFGSVFPLILGLALMIYGIFLPQIQRVLQQRSYLTLLWHGLWLIFWLWLLSLLLFFAFLQHNAQQNHQIPAVKAMLILGGGVDHDQPTATVAERLDTAASYIQQHPHIVVIATGGMGFKEQFSEAEVMTNYLYRHYDLRQTTIYPENKSTSTEDNFKYSALILKQQGLDLSAPILIVSSDYHLPRAQAIARHLGYQNSYTLAAPTPLNMRYNNWLREYFAYISGYLLNEY